MLVRFAVWLSRLIERRGTWIKDTGYSSHVVWGPLGAWDDRYGAWGVYLKISGHGFFYEDVGLDQNMFYAK